MRSDKELITDRILLLYTIEKANRHGRMEGTFKLQKIPFASELEMSNQGIKGFNYSFFRYTHGPLSKEIYDDGGALHKAGLITTLKGPIKLTDTGAKLFDSVSSLYAENREVLKYVDDAAKTYAPLSFGRLKKRIYDLKVDFAGDEWTVRQIPPYTDMLSGLLESEAKLSFLLDDDWVDSLWGTLNYSEDESKKLHVVRRVAS